MTGEPEYVEGEMIKADEECTKQTIEIRGLPYHIYIAQASQYDVAFDGNSRTTHYDTCVYHAKDYSYVKYVRFFYADPTVPWSGIAETGVAVSYGVDGIFQRVDGLVTDEGQYLGSGSNAFIQHGAVSQDLRYYNDLRDHIIQHADGTLSLDGQPDYIYMDRAGNAPVVRGLGLSHNKRWMTFGVANFGIILLDRGTMQSNRVSDRYDNVVGYGTPPALTTSASDDGRYIITGGTRNQTEVITVTSSCGSSNLADGYAYHSQLLAARTCSYRDLTTMTNDHSSIMNPVGGIRGFIVARMSASGDMFTYWDNYKWNTIYAPNYLKPGQLYYLALGDSFASGEGDISIDGVDHYFAGTNVYGDYNHGIARETCHLSTRSYSMRIAAAMRLTKGADMQSVACSGAVTSDLLTLSNKSSGYINTQYLGQNTQLIKSVGPRLTSISSAASLQNQARQNYTPGRVQQIEFVKKAQPKYMTVMIGGNDIDFGGILGSCAFNSLPSADDTCDYAQPTGLAVVVEKIHALYPTLLKFYTALHEASPNTTIYVIGYPQFMDDTNKSCMEMADLYSKAERKAFRQMVAYANAVIKNAALDAGAKYIDISDALTGGQLCDSGTDMTGITDVLSVSIYTAYMKSLTMSDSMIAKYLNVFPAGEIHRIALQMYVAERAAAIVQKISYSPATALADVMQQFSHPNALGHEAIYDTIRNALGDDLLESVACNQKVVCPDSVTHGQPDVSQYVPGFVLDPDGDTAYVGVGGKVVPWRRDPSGGVIYGALVKGASEQFIELPAATLTEVIDDTRPVVVELHSQPTVLGAMTRVGDVYRLKTSLPQDVIVGQHVLYIRGTLVDGRAFEIDSSVFVEGPQGDIDDDGIADSVDTCAFGKPSGIDVDRDGIDDACDLSTRAEEGTSSMSVSQGASSQGIVGGSSSSGLSTRLVSTKLTQQPATVFVNVANTNRDGDNKSESGAAMTWLIMGALGVLLALIAGVLAYITRKQNTVRR